MLKLGAHQSISGGYDKALERISNIGGNCLQIFSSSPRGWTFADMDSARNDKFILSKKRLKINPVYFHATYLINLADSDRIGYLSKKALITELNIASKLGIVGTIVHLGSYKNDETDKKYQILIRNIQEVLNKTPKNSLFIIENAGNHKIGQKLEEISIIIKKISDKRLKICLDTCHLYSSGYRFKNGQELKLFLDKLDKLNLLDKLEVFHINDSRDSFNSGRDRHENIGQGTIPMTEFATLLNHERTKDLPFIIETPGFDQNGPDKKNLDILKSLVKN